ncbi:MAG: YidC/Oxa1 family membrane protein insertase [Aristaeellaceae bacterium]
MNEFLKGILDGIYSLVGSYGWSIVIFTLLIRLVLMPFDYKSRVGMRKTAKIQPQLNELQKKYAKDQEKLQKKTSELYRKEKINPLSSCLPILLTMPILFAMFAAMRMIANEQVVQQAFAILQGETPVMEGWLWIKNVWMPDSPFAAAWPNMSMLQQVPQDIWQSAIAAMPAETLALINERISAATGTMISYETFGTSLQGSITAVYQTMAQMPAYVEHVATLPGFSFNLIFTVVSVVKNFNGLFILPIVAAVSQYLMTVLQPATPAPASNDPKAQSAQGTNTFMKWFFPLFSLWICASSNASFSLYWVVSNLIAMVQTFGINKYLDMKEKKAETIGEGTIK